VGETLTVGAGGWAAFQGRLAAAVTSTFDAILLSTETLNEISDV
jgi:hypothetical protein